jgi:hypothetical protein
VINEKHVKSPHFKIKYDEIITGHTAVNMITCEENSSPGSAWDFEIIMTPKQASNFESNKIINALMNHGEFSSFDHSHGVSAISSPGTRRVNAQSYYLQNRISSPKTSLNLSPKKSSSIEKKAGKVEVHYSNSF